MPVEPKVSQLKRKPRAEHAPYKPRKPQVSLNKDSPQTSAQPLRSCQKHNLTLHDWLTIFTYIDAHPGISQDAVVNHFKTRVEGSLTFDQSTLSRKLKEHKKLEGCVHEFPNALSMKRQRIVTRPDVENALFLWVKHMEEKRETVNGPMLVAKRAKFKESLGVPEEERLQGDGWIPKFKKAYGIKEYRRHGEAASVDLAAVKAERARLRTVLAKYAQRDRFNFDETSLFAFAPPDRGLATEQMSGKKKDKFRITMGLACNADGSEKLPLFFIGKYKNPRCFKQKSPDARGLYYRNNTKAWMTKEIFEEWIKSLDVTMRHQDRHICLLLDNFAGHFIEYKPRNIDLEYFEPNLTSYIQPDDAGIIRTVKALYRKAFCLRAIELDEAGEREIYKINLLEAMTLVTEAWRNVQPATIVNCWNHTKIQPETETSIQSSTGDITTTSHSSPMTDTRAWMVVKAFATSDEYSLPAAEHQLGEILGDRYLAADWDPVLKVVMDAEKDLSKALEGLDVFTLKIFNCRLAHLTFTSAAHQQDNTATLTLPQLDEAERGLSEAVDNLQKRKRIIGAPLTLEEMLNPIGEEEVGDSDYRFEGGDEEIIARVKHEEAVKCGEVIEVESDDEDSDGEVELGLGELIEMTAKLENACFTHGTLEGAADLSRRLRQFRIELRRMKDSSLQQPTLRKWIGSKAK